MRVHHLAFRTHDVRGLAAFYEQWLGLAVVREALPRAVWLGLDDAVLMIELAGPDEPRVVPNTLEFVALRTDERGRETLRARLLEAGRLEGETAHTLYFRDPDGRRVGVSTHPLLS